MEIKQLITNTVEELAQLSETEQVEVFNEIKCALLHHRKNRQEAHLKAIQELTELNNLITEGSSKINGDFNGTVTVRGEDLMNTASRNRGY